MKRLLLYFSLSALLLGLTLGCKRKPKKDPYQGTAAAKLLQDGEKALKQGKFEQGRRMLRYIEENLPGSPEFPRAKFLLGDGFFFAGSGSYPEARVEYQSFLNYFPRHEMRDYALYHLALCHYASIESADRDQTETQRAIEAFNYLLREMPGSPYAIEARAKITQCWRRIAEHELMVAIFYVNTYHFAGAEKRLKGLLETSPDYVDRERAYYYLGEAMRQKFIPLDEITRVQKSELEKLQKEDIAKLSKEELTSLRQTLTKFQKGEQTRYKEEAKSYYQKLTESYPGTEWARRASDRLVEMGSTGVKEELDS